MQKSAQSSSGCFGAQKVAIAAPRLPNHLLASPLYNDANNLDVFTAIPVPIFQGMNAVLAKATE